MRLDKVVQQKYLLTSDSQCIEQYAGIHGPYLMYNYYDYILTNKLSNTGLKRVIETLVRKVFLHPP